MARTRTSSDVELLLPLDRESPQPLHRQLEQGLREAIRDGRLPAATGLPSSRAFAAQLGVSRGIVVEAYEQLLAEGYLASRPGGATRVARSAIAAPFHAPEVGPAPAEFDFRPGRPDVSEFPRAVWLRSLRAALLRAPSDRLTYLGGHGIPELRLALATYLNRARGTAADPVDVVICSGFAQGLALTARAMRARGARVVAVEDPSDPEYRATLAAAGLDSVGVPVDEHGLRVDLLEQLDVDGVVVTAAHQYPTGGVLPPDRRAALADWAARAGRADHRGRLRRRVPLRPRAGRRDPGPVPRRRGVRGFGEQGAGTRAAPGLAAVAAGADPEPDRWQAGRRHGLARPRPARVRRRPRARRARPPPAPDAPDLPRPSRRAAGRARPPPARPPAGRGGGGPPRPRLAARRRRRGGRRRGRGRGRHRAGRPLGAAHRARPGRPDLRLRGDRRSRRSSPGSRGWPGSSPRTAAAGPRPARPPARARRRPAHRRRPASLPRTRSSGASSRSCRNRPAAGRARSAPAPRSAAPAAHR